MNKKRFIIGFLLVCFSVFFVIPKPDQISFLNWQKDTLNVILGLIPLVLILKGFLGVSNETSDNSLNITKLMVSADDEKNIDNYEKNANFDTKDFGWRSEGYDIWQANVENNKLIVDKGYETCHYGKKFHRLDLKQIKIKSNISDEMNSEISIEVGTNTKKEPVDRLDSENCEESIKYVLTNKKEKINPDLDFKEFSFIKILIDKRNEEEIELYRVTVKSEKN